MQVLVTGGIGRVGKAVVERLIRHNWDVRVADLPANADVPGAEYQACDITQYEQTRAAVRDCQAVVHLAAIANPMQVPAPDIFHVNVTGAYNVFEAAAAEGIRRVVQASSINAFGCFWGNRDIAPDYLPIDEDHPTCTTDVYSFSKELVEDIGAYYWRRCGISSVGLRFPGVWHAGRITSDDVRRHREEARAVVDEFAAQPEPERRERLAQIRQATVEFRGKGNMEHPQAKDGFRFEGYAGDPLWRLYAMERFNFWAYVDERDAAQSVEKGLIADYEGAYPLFINAHDNALGYESETLAQLFFPEVPARQHPLHGTESLVSIEQARSLIGFEPQHAIVE